MLAAEAIKAPPAILARLKKLGVLRGDDLVLHLPMRYEDETQVAPIAQAPAGVPAQVEARVIDVSVQFRPRRQLVVRVEDESGDLVLRFLNFYGSQTKQLERARDDGRKLRLFGEIRPGFLGAEMVHPRYRVVGDNEALPQALTPVYPTTAGLSQNVLRKLIAPALAQADLSELLDARWCHAQALPAFDEAVQLLHAPPPGVPEAALQQRTHPAWRRIKFDEILAQQLSLRRAYLARRQQGAVPLRAAGMLARRLLASLPFKLTGAQRRVIAEISADLTQPCPMQRLLQGDVGSGKTIVAALAACQAIEAGYQVAFMAPTEILAEQHYLKLRGWFAPLGIEVGWLTGSLKKAAKQAVQLQVAGSAQLIVGTHALIQEGVDFARLGLAIVDEQHRFGVQQRLALRDKGADHVSGLVPHQLVLTATPIPRTLAMSAYADLDVSSIDELPPGRTPVQTIAISNARRFDVIERIHAACGEGRQVYWVCTLIEESEQLRAQAAEVAHAELSSALIGFQVGLIHGRMKPKEKQAAMDAFKAGELSVLVATTVIEVGVDVPNASLMVIENSERLGLAQLHQLRGRVGRGAVASNCVLLYQPALGQLARERLQVMRETIDCFRIAEKDLELRGPGEVLGTRQTGQLSFRIADLARDAHLLPAVQQVGERMLAEHPAQTEQLIERWIGGAARYVHA